MEQTLPVLGARADIAYGHHLELRTREDLLKIPMDGAPVTVTVPVTQSDATWPTLLRAMGGRRWQLILSAATGMLGTTGVRDLSWLSTAVTPPSRIYTNDPALHTFPGLERLPVGVEAVCLDGVGTRFDWHALTAKLATVRELDSRPIGSSPCDLGAFLANGAPPVLRLHHHEIIPARDGELDVCAIQLDACRVRSERLPDLAKCLQKVRRLRLEGSARGLGAEWIDDLPALDWLELRGVPQMEALPEVRRSRAVLRVLRLWENRRLRDVSSIGGMVGLRSLGILDCPKLDVSRLISAENVRQLEQVAVGRLRKADAKALAEVVPDHARAMFDDVEGF